MHGLKEASASVPFFLTDTAMPPILANFDVYFLLKNNRQRELLEAFGVDEAACDIKEAERSLRAENSEEIVETTESFEGDRIPKAVDDGDPDL